MTNAELRDELYRLQWRCDDMNARGILLCLMACLSSGRVDALARHIESFKLTEIERHEWDFRSQSISGEDA
jgi:hypothetical protein